MSQIRCYINPFDDSGNYTGWVDVSADVKLDSIGSFTSSLDGSDFDVGIFTFGNITININNASGKYSDVDDIRSIFRYRRGGSKVKITWQKGDNDAVCNFSTCGEIYPYYELNVVEGLLNDESLTTDLRLADNSFKLLSYASIFDSVEAPYSSLTNGDTVLEILTVLLAESDITKTITIDSANINPNLNAVIDDVSGYEDSSVKDIIDDMLLISNSVLYFEEDTLFIGPRTPTTTVQQTFYGQASKLGIEDMQKVDKIRSGLSRTFNLWKWEDTTLSARSQTSIDDHGLRINDLNIDAITNNTTRQAILNSYSGEFFEPKREFKFTTTLDVENRNNLDRVNFDYPTPYYTTEGVEIPLYTKAVYGVSKYPFGEYSLELGVLEFFKVISIGIDLKKGLITYGVREI